MAESYPTLPAELPSVGGSFDIPYEHSVEFDFTTFESADAFSTLCEQQQLTESTTNINETVDGFRRKYYQWYNDDVLMATCCNPLTGEMMPSSGQLEYRHPGYASRIMLQGTTDAVVALYEDIVTSATHIKGGEVTEDRIMPDGTHIRCDDRFADRLQQFVDPDLQDFS